MANFHRTPALRDNSNVPPLLFIDFYKAGHREQYPTSTETVYSTWTPRRSYIADVTHVVAFGFQKFIIKYLVDYFNQHFFARPEDEVASEYARYIKHCIGVENPDTSHIRELHKLGYLPLRIKALPEGTLVPFRVPMLTIENTNPRFFWLTNYVETLMSSELWPMITAATISLKYRNILESWAEKTDDDISFVKFQGHDFSMRGLMGVDAATLVGPGHLLNFVGTDTVPAIWALEYYYGANIENELVGCSVFATEHSVMSAGGKSHEYDTVRRLINETYPSGIVSIVSDTWNLWYMISHILPSLKLDIMNRNGKVVIRPDSGDPVKILCGDPDASDPYARKGVIECLWDIFGGTYTSKGYKKLDSHIGAIYGDSITPDRAEAICAGLAAKGFASTNVVLGIGSFTYQMNTRDTFGLAMKSSSVTIAGVEYDIFKDPITDDGTKKSLKGRVCVYESAGGLTVKDQMPVNSDLWQYNLLETIFYNGDLKKCMSLSEIREHLTAQRDLLK